MMTFSAVSNENYYLNLAAEDYYLQGGEPPGVWVGLGTYSLNLKGQVEAKQLSNLMKGSTPNGKETLCQNAGENHKAGWDLTFGAPKSVSILWAAADDKLRDGIQQAQLNAVKDSISLIEEHAAYTRRGAQGSEREKVEGLITAVFPHSTSRDLDPHLHSHSVLCNVAQRSDGTWGTIDSRQIMLWQKAAGMVYKGSLAASMRELGFETELDKDSFKIAGVPKKLCEHFSKRSVQINNELKKRGIRSRFSKSGDIVALATRDTKTEIDRPALFAQWQKEMVSLGFNLNTVNELRKSDNKIDLLSLNTIDEDQLISELTESNSTYRLQDAFYQAGLNVIQYNQTIKTLRVVTEQSIASEETISLGTDWKNNKLFTSKSVLIAEQSMIARAISLRKSNWATIDTEAINFAINNQPFQLSDEQQFAVMNVCDDSQLSILQGSAGAGKSASMLCVRDIHQAHGKKVVGAAIAKAAANNLAKEAKIECHTIARLLYSLDSKKPPLESGDVLIVDEAGQIGTFQMNSLLTFAKEIGFKIVLVGEDRQLDAIQHGGVLRLLSTPEIIGTTRVETIRRQHNAWDRQAVADFRDGYAHQALAQYSKRGQLHFAENDDVAKESLIQSWNEYRRCKPDKKSIVIAQSWNDVIQLNNRMRKELQTEGLVGYENIQIQGTVSDRDIDFQVSVGERIRFTKNDYAKKYTNGDIGTVTKAQLMDNGDIWLRVHLDSGRKTQFMVSDYCNDDGRVYLTQAYAQTVYSSQGLTIDGDVFVYYTQFMDRAHSYVACSRHKDKAHIFANAQDLEEYIPDNFKHAPREVGLREALAKNMSRNNRPKLAVEHLSKEELNNILEPNTKLKEHQFII
ncbi:MobF family relaxase [Colwellia sp. BRX10-4]|uniref:MobF family relaxase n=1 Tax=Colwellia sp. BRX10-4 TaxID=2759843 RepID=UPI0015F7062F|nr:MobF family relaxase [Colwellia sp. BRX10-4]MBA6397675.1 relaxase domain-containing protein [Colwellia sp. BRX10-4]